MFDTVKRIIAEGVRDLPGLTQRIDEMYAVGDLTRAETDELKALAVENAAGYGSVSRTLEARVAALEARLDVLESTVQTGETGSTGGLKSTAGLPTYSDGMVAADGTVWLYNGGVWQSAAGDYGLCWGPDVLPQYWINVSAEYDI